MNLVAVGDALDRIALEDLLALSRAEALERPSARVARFISAHRHDAVAPFCSAHRLDHAYVEDGIRFAGLRLLAMDMDSTLITIECIDEIAGMIGIKDRIAAITGSAMRGEIDFSASLRQRVALLAGTPESLLERVYEEKLRLSPGTDKLLAACREHGVRTLLVSGGFTYFTERLRVRLGLDWTLSNVLEVESGRLTGRVLGSIVNAESKASRFREIAADLGAPREQTVAIGDGANDLLMMAEAGFSIAYHAKPAVRAKAACAIDFGGLDTVLNFLS